MSEGGLLKDDLHFLMLLTKTAVSMVWLARNGVRELLWELSGELFCDDAVFVWRHHPFRDDVVFVRRQQLFRGDVVFVQHHELFGHDVLLVRRPELLRADAVLDHRSSALHVLVAVEDDEQRS